MHRFYCRLWTWIGFGGALLGSVALAGPPASSDPIVHELEFSDEGNTLEIEAELTGLDPNRDAFVWFTALAKIELACVNSGGKVVKAEKPRDLELELSGFAFYPMQLLRGGRLELELDTDSVGRSISGAPDCPNASWKEPVLRVRFLDARLELHQAGEVELDLLCMFHPPSEDGEVPNHRVKCFTI
jgi:hypothetical protein